MIYFALTYLVIEASPILALWVVEPVSQLEAGGLLSSGEGELPSVVAEIMINEKVIS